MKAVSDRVAKKRLLELANFLENGVPSEHFNFGTFGDVENDDVPPGTDALKEANLCGTAACALGWAPALPFAKRLGYKLQVRKHGSVDFTKNGRVIGIWALSKALFGLNPGQANTIFFHGHLNEYKDGVSDVANGIRKFVAIRFG